MRRLDLLNKRFAKLTVLSNGKKDKYNRRLWKCLCNCGNIKHVSSSDLVSQKVKSCGCLNTLFKKRELNPNWNGGATIYICKACGQFFERYHPISEHHTNEYCSNKCKGKHLSSLYSGEKSPVYRRITRECGFCGKEIKVPPFKLQYKNNFCKRKKGEKLSSCHVAWMMEKNAGEKNPNWRNGSKQNPYCDIWLDDEYKQSIKVRDGKCMNPQCKHISDTLHIHHIDYDKMNCEPDNLIVLCNSCHSLANFKRKKHEVRYKRLMARTYNYEYEFQSSIFEAVNH